jgi:vacuolar iron transporter family protein
MTSSAVEPPSELPGPTIIRSKSSRSRPHSEQHSEHGDVIRDIIIGFADGLTVPFALTAGLSSYVALSCFLCHLLTRRYPSLGSSRLVIIGGLAELFSGSISMGLGAYLASVTERDHFISEEKREKDEVENKPEDEKAEIHGILGKYGISQGACELVVQDLECNPDNWVQVRYPSSLLLACPRLCLRNG